MMKIITGGQDNGLEISLFKVVQDKVTSGQLCEMKAHHEKIYATLPLKIAHFEQHLIRDTFTSLYFLKISLIKSRKLLQVFIPFIGSNSCAKREIIFPLEKYKTASNIDDFYMRGNFQLLSNIKELGIVLSKSKLNEQQKVQILMSNLLFKPDILHGKLPIKDMSFQALARGQDIKFEVSRGIGNQEDVQMVRRKKKRKI